MGKRSKSVWKLIQIAFGSETGSEPLEVRTQDAPQESRGRSSSGSANLKSLKSLQFLSEIDLFKSTLKHISTHLYIYIIYINYYKFTLKHDSTSSLLLQHEAQMLRHEGELRL